MIVIVDYGVGNLGSIINMLKKAGAKAIASSDPDGSS
jgi:glutamine amidotransferase